MANQNNQTPFDEQFLQQLFDGQLTIKEEVNMKVEAHGEENRELFEHVNELKEMIDDGVAAAMIALTSLETAYAPGVVVKRSRAFIRLIRKLLQNTRDYESSVRLALDYDVNDRIRIGSMGWYVGVIELLNRHQTKLRVAFYTFTGNDAEKIHERAEAGFKLLRECQLHCRNRFPGYAEYFQRAA